MNKRRVRLGRSFLAWCLSLLLLACTVWICGDAVLGSAWGAYIRGEIDTRLGKPAGQPSLMSVTVPDLTEQPFSVDALDEALFELSVTYTENEASPRTVLTQSPAPGTRRRVVPGQRRVPIFVTVSTGPRTAVVPDVYGTEGRQAEIQLRACGFAVTVAPFLPDNDMLRYVPRGTYTIPTPGTAIYTEPGAGHTLTAGSEVTLYVVSETPTISPICPKVVGMTVEEARRVLHAAGVPIGRIYEESGTAAPGTVVAQSRLAGTLLSPDDRIDLTIVKQALSERHFWDHWPFIKQKGYYVVWNIEKAEGLLR